MAAQGHSKSIILRSLESR